MRDVSWHAHICDVDEELRVQIVGVGGLEAPRPLDGRAARYATSASRCRSRSESCSGVTTPARPRRRTSTSQRRESPSRSLRSPRSHTTASRPLALTPRRPSSLIASAQTRQQIDAIVAGQCAASSPVSAGLLPYRSGSRDPQRARQPRGQCIDEMRLRCHLRRRIVAAPRRRRARRACLRRAVLEPRVLTQPIELDQRVPARERIESPADPARWRARVLAEQPGEPGRRQRSASMTLAIFISFSSVSNCGCALPARQRFAGRRRQRQELLQRRSPAVHAPRRADRRCVAAGQRRAPRDATISAPPAIRRRRRLRLSSTTRMSLEHLRQVSSVGTNDAAR